MVGLIGDEIFGFYIHLLLSMFMGHVIGDSVFQTSSISLKKRESYWKSYGNYKRYFYIFYLLVHSFIWSSTIHISLLIILGVKYFNKILISYIVNILLHSIIDDMKANRKLFNLIVDQFLHSLQILLTFYFVVLF